MLPRDLSTYLRLRRIARNPWATLRFEKRTAPGQVHVVQLNGGPYLYLRADREDSEAFNRVLLRDVYRIARPPRGGWGVVIDLGGHIGLFAARVSRSAARVITYEPCAESFACLARNIAACLNVDAVCAAVAGDPGPLKLYHPSDSRRSGLYSCYRDASPYLSDAFDEVSAVTLEDVFVQHDVQHCDLLKLTVAGQEYDIIYAAPKELLERIERIHGAYHDVDSHRPRTRIGYFSRFLGSRGFRVDVVPDPAVRNQGYFFATRG